MDKDKVTVLDKISSFFDRAPRRQPEVPININDVSQSFTNGMSQREMDAYDAYLQNNTRSTGQLPLSAYYPDAGSSVAAGNYSGRVVGSNTIYAPGGGLVPLGMIDARQKALEDAAADEARNIEAFRTQFKAPTSDLVNINEDLTEQYFGHIESGWQSALKKAKGNPSIATQILKQDPQFWQKEKSYQDLAKEGNSLAKKIADIDERIKKGAVMSPSLRAAKENVLRVADPSSPDFKNFSLAIRRMDADREFNDSMQDVMKNVSEQITGRALDLSNPDDYKVFKETVKEYTPEQKKYAKETILDIYSGSDMYSPDYINRNVEAVLGNVNVTKDLDVKAKPIGDANDNYTEDDISKEPSSTNVYVNTGQEPSFDDAGNPVLDEKGNQVMKTGTRKSVLTGVSGITHKKPILATIPTGAKVYINDEAQGLIPSKEVAPNTKSQLFKTEIVKVSPNLGVPLTDDQIASGMPYKYEVMTTGVMTGVDKDGAQYEKQFFVPTNQVENALIKRRDKSGKVIKGIPVDKLYNERDKLNKEIKKPSSKSKEEVPNVPTYSRDE